MTTTEQERERKMAHTLAFIAALLCLASCQSSDDRAWADYSRGLNHVLNK